MKDKLQCRNGGEMKQKDVSIFSAKEILLVIELKTTSLCK